MSKKKRITDWTPDQEYKLAKLYSYYEDAFNKWIIIGEEMNMLPENCRMHWRLHGARLRSRLDVSPYPRYDKPLVMEADKCLVLPDPEFPFHHAEFINRVLDLAQAWKIENCIIAGDMLHFDSLSSWSPSWQVSNGKGGLDDKQELELLEFLKTLGSKQQERGFELLEKIGHKSEDGDPNVSEELTVARKAVKALSECFRNIDMILGNHEGRLLRQLHSPLFPAEITRLIDAKNWRVEPFYYSYLKSNGVNWVVDHPKNYTPIAAEKLASKYQSNVIMGHSHILRFSFDTSGNYYAITTGCCADETRLPYAAQRHSTSPAHALGATIVRDGYPYLIHKGIDWKRMETMK